MGEQRRASALRPPCQWPGCLRAIARGLANQTHCSVHFQLLHDARDGNEPNIGGPQPIAPKKRGRPPVPKAVPIPAPPCPSANLDLFADDMVPEYVLDGMVDRCEFCGALNFPAERVGTSVSRRVTLCYKGGKLSHLPPIPDAPEPLRSWLLAPGAHGRAFRNNIRRYNAALSFVSFGDHVEVRGGHAQQRAPPVCIIHGAVYHHSHPLRADDASSARFAQLYLYDATQANGLRVDADQALCPETLTELTHMLDRVGNPYAEAYRRMGELTQEP